MTTIRIQFFDRPNDFFFFSFVWTWIRHSHIVCVCVCMCQFQPLNNKMVNQNCVASALFFCVVLVCVGSSWFGNDPCEAHAHSFVWRRKNSSTCGERKIMCIEIFPKNLIINSIEMPMNWTHKNKRSFVNSLICYILLAANIWTLPKIWF